MNSGRTFLLTEHQTRFVDAQVSSGRHASSSNVVSEALSRYEDDTLHEEAYLRYVEGLAERGEAAFAAGDVVRVKRYALAEFISDSANRTARRQTARDEA